MPITLPPISRRQFIKSSIALGGTTLLNSRALAASEGENSKDVSLDPSRVALLADTHISADRTLAYPGTKWPGSPVGEDEHEFVNMADSLSEAAKSIIALNPRPAHLIVNGDCALSNGKDAEYKEFLRLIEPIREAGITVHVTIGNHDNREKLWKLLPFLKQEQMGLQAGVIELPHTNLILLDSGKRGTLGEKQLEWLAKELDQRTDKPALIFGHYNPAPNRGVRPIRGMRDGASLLKLLAERKHARAYLHGHTHEWQHEQRDHLHIITQPAVSYYFGKGHANGWVDMKLSETSADLELQCINPKHKQHGEQRQVSLIERKPDSPIKVRVGSYNVLFGELATPEQIGEMLKPYKLDIIGFNEVPDGDWTARVGQVLGMEHSYVGKISSANHKDKYKSILSHTPLDGTSEIELEAPRRRSWSPASAVRAETEVNGLSFAFYSLHICSSGQGTVKANENSHAYQLATNVLPNENKERVIVVGDYNNNIVDPAIVTLAEAGYNNTWDDLKIDVSKKFTYIKKGPKGKDLGVIDHILYNTASGAKATDGGIIELEKHLSDHKPVWAEIVFP